MNRHHHQPTCSSCPVYSSAWSKAKPSNQKDVQWSRNFGKDSGRFTFWGHNKTPPFPRSPVNHLHDVYELLLIRHGPVDLHQSSTKVQSLIALGCCSIMSVLQAPGNLPRKHLLQRRRVTLLLFPVPRSIMMCCKKKTLSDLLRCMNSQEVERGVKA